MSDERTPDERIPTDGGEPAMVAAERAGDAPPEVPTDDGLERLLPDLLGDSDGVEPAYLVRATLDGANPHSTAEQLLAALADKVSVVGDTLDAGLDPVDPALDVLVETDYEPGVVARSMAGLDPIRGVTVADVTDRAAGVLDAEEADAVDANDVFNDIKEQVDQLGYGDVVDELEDVSFPGGPDPDEELDLQEETGIDLEEPEPIDLGGGDSSPPSGDDDATGDEPLSEADEDAVSRAIREIELESDADGAATEDEPDPIDIEEPAGSADAQEVDDTAGPGHDDTAGPGHDDTAGPGHDDTAGPGSDHGTTDAAAEEADAGGGSAGVGASGADEDVAADSGEDAGLIPDAAGPAAWSPEDVDAFVGALATALESGAVDEERRAALREALGIDSTHSLDVRLEYLQKRVDNLAAYTDAWEAFLGEEGTGREFVEDVRSDLDELEARVADVESAGGPGSERHDEVGAALGDVEERLATLDERLSGAVQRHDEDVARLDTRVDSVGSKAEQRLDGVEEAVGALREKVEALLQWREHVNDVLSGGGR